MERTNMKRIMEMQLPVMEMTVGTGLNKSLAIEIAYKILFSKSQILW
jgi:hypothetical protein